MFSSSGPHVITLQLVYSRMAPSPRLARKMSQEKYYHPCTSLYTQLLRQQPPTGTARRLNVCRVCRSRGHPTLGVYCGLLGFWVWLLGFYAGLFKALGGRQASIGFYLFRVLGLGFRMAFSLGFYRILCCFCFGGFDAGSWDVGCRSLLVCFCCLAWLLGFRF